MFGRERSNALVIRPASLTVGCQQGGSASRDGGSRKLRLNGTGRLACSTVKESFLKELPSLVRWWIGLCLIAVVLAWVTGYQEWPAALWFGLGLLPFGIPMIPVFWMSVGWGGFDFFPDRRQWLLLLGVLGWIFVTLLFALGIATVIWGIGGVENV
jgi:hypothetical protein